MNSSSLRASAFATVTRLRMSATQEYPPSFAISLSARRSYTRCIVDGVAFRAGPSSDSLTTSSRMKRYPRSSASSWRLRLSSSGSGVCRRRSVTRSVLLTTMWAWGILPSLSSCRTIATSKSAKCLFAHACASSATCSVERPSCGSGDMTKCLKVRAGLPRYVVSFPHACRVASIAAAQSKPSGASETASKVCSSCQAKFITCTPSARPPFSRYRFIPAHPVCPAMGFSSGIVSRPRLSRAARAPRSSGRARRARPRPVRAAARIRRACRTPIPGRLVRGRART